MLNIGPEGSWSPDPNLMRGLGTPRVLLPGNLKDDPARTRQTLFLVPLWPGTKDT